MALPAVVIPLIARAAAPRIAAGLAQAALRGRTASMLATTAQSRAHAARLAAIKKRPLPFLFPVWIPDFPWPDPSALPEEGFFEPAQAGGYDFTGWTTLTECAGRGRNIMNNALTVTNCTLGTTQTSNWNSGLNQFNQSQINNPSPARRRVTVAMFESVNPVPDDPAFVNAVRAWRGRKDYLLADYPNPITYADLAADGVVLPEIAPSNIPTTYAGALPEVLPSAVPLHQVYPPAQPILGFLPPLAMPTAAQSRVMKAVRAAVKHPEPVPYPQLPPAPRVITGTPSDTVPVVWQKVYPPNAPRLATGSHALRTPPPRTRERKFRAAPAVKALFDIYGAVDEIRQLIDVLYEAVPAHLRPRHMYVDREVMRWRVSRFEKRSMNTMEKLRVIYDHLGSIDTNAFLRGWIANQLSDVAIGQVSSWFNNGLRAAGLPAQPISPFFKAARATGNNLAAKSKANQAARKKLQQQLDYAMRFQTQLYTYDWYGAEVRGRKTTRQRMREHIDRAGRQRNTPYARIAGVKGTL